MDISFSRRPPSGLRHSRSVWNFGSTKSPGGINKSASPSNSPRRLRTSHSNLEKLNTGSPLRPGLSSRGSLSSLKSAALLSPRGSVERLKASSSLSRHRSYGNLNALLATGGTFNDLLSRSRHSSSLALQSRASSPAGSIVGSRTSTLTK